MKMSNSKPMHSLSCFDVHGEEGTAINDPIQQRQHRSLISTLLYLAVRSSPDISVAASIFGAFVEKRRAIHLQAAKRAVWYLKGIKAVMLNMSPDKRNQPVVYADASWTNKFDKGRQSRKEILMEYSNSAIYTTRQRHWSVSLNYTESEYVAPSNPCQMVKWLRGLLSELEEAQQPTRIFRII